MKRSDGEVSYHQVGKKSGMASSRVKFQVTILNKIFQGGRDYAPALSAQWSSLVFAWFDEQAVPKVRLRQCGKSARFSSHPSMEMGNGQDEFPNQESATCGYNSIGECFISLVLGIIYLSAVIYGGSETGKSRLQPCTMSWGKKALGSIILLSLTFSARPPSLGLFTSLMRQLNLASFNYNGRSETGEASHSQWYIES